MEGVASSGSDHFGPPAYMAGGSPPSAVALSVRARGGAAAGGAPFDRRH